MNVASYDLIPFFAKGIALLKKIYLALMFINSEIKKCFSICIVDF